VIPNAIKATGLFSLSYAETNPHRVMYKNRNVMWEKKLFARVRVRGLLLRLVPEVIPNAIYISGLVLMFSAAFNQRFSRCLREQVSFVKEVVFAWELARVRVSAEVIRTAIYFRV
jgi:hypothetical protein